MCGICGFYDVSGKAKKVDEGVLGRMTETLVHRGPDSSGRFLAPSIGLGFRRLSLIDLSGGDQPLYNEDRSLVLICNGEIYNYRELRDELVQKGHRFSTRSDVEVVLHLYEDCGADLLQRLNGQFAFALYDVKQRSLLLARDHFGINPLYYAKVDGMFVFGSEIKAILEFPGMHREVDLTGLDQVMTFPGLVSPRTMFKGISSLPAGHYLLLKGEQFFLREYWDLEYPTLEEIHDGRPESYYAEKLKEALERSVKARLHADVPVGFYLSGGLDSSLIAALIGEVSNGSERHSFSITFTDRELCEAKYQKLMSRQVGSIHHEIEFDWPEISHRLKQAVYHSEAPLKETYNTASLALSEHARGHDTPAILTGEGADELFAGYVGYRFDQLGRRRNAYDLEEVLESEMRYRLWGDSDLFYEKDYYRYADTKKALYSAGLAHRFSEFDCLQFGLVNKDRLCNRHSIHQRSYLDFKLRMADHLLSDHGDRMALANSIEARYPFLDLDVAKVAAEIPPAWQTKGLVEKYILRMAAEPLVPREILEREKYAFLAPGSPYLLGQNIEWINDLLSYHRIKREGYFNPDTVETLKSLYTRKGFALNLPFESDLLIIVITFGIFLEMFDMPSLN